MATQTGELDIGLERLKEMAKAATQVEQTSTELYSLAFAEWLVSVVASGTGDAAP